jgi:uncharacterized protein (DUF885 family)
VRPSALSVVSSAAHTLVPAFVLLCLAGACSPSKTDNTSEMTTGMTSAADGPASPRLKALFAASDEQALKRNPMMGLFRGDLRYTDKFGEYQSDAYFAAERAAADHELAALDSIDRKTLNANDQISYDTFKWQRRLDRRGLEPELLEATKLRPIDHFNGFHTQFVDISSGQGAARFKTLKDYDDGLERLHGFARELDTTLVKFQGGLAAGIVHPKIVTKNVIGQLETLIKQGVDSSPLYAPTQHFPGDIPKADQIRLSDSYRDAIQREVVPSFTRLKNFLSTEYLPKSRDSVGLSAMKGGPALYRYQVAVQTTTSLTPDSIHSLGLGEVARIKAGMEAIKMQVAFKGTLHDFFEDIRTNPKFQPASKQALKDGYDSIGKRVDASIPKLFSTLPKAPMEIRVVPAYLEKNQAGGYYQQGTPDGSRPGVFYYNTYDLKSRSTPGMETLYLHEGVPGHHFQISLAQENDALPNFQRFGGNNAFVEGWALYAESLGPELGMFTDPYQHFGSLNDEMLRAMRLVVDTGLHEKGWTRDQAIAYMLDNSAMGRTDAISEVERYIAMPAQALGYKIGQLTIRRLRTKAEQALGATFDVRAFHAQVLNTGALPLDVLESKIDRWIASQKH